MVRSPDPLWKRIHQRESTLAWLFLLPGLLVAAAIFAAWWLFIRAGDHPSVPNQAPGVLDAPSSVGPMLLQASQLGPTYDQSAEDTRATTSVEIRKGQSPAATRIIAHTWKAGARAGWCASRTE